MKKLIALLGVSMLFFAFGCATKSPITTPDFKEPTEGLLIIGATVHLGNGETIEDAYLAVKDGIITLLTDKPVRDKKKEDYEIDRLGPGYHIYPFKEAEASNVGVVLARPEGDPVNLALSDNESEPLVKEGVKAQLLICIGNIKDKDKFKVSYVLYGEDKVEILRQGNYSGGINLN